MSGTINLSMTQQFNAQGVPLTGGKLYIFQTGTLIPQNSYSDSGLTSPLPNPITLNSSGRIPQFFLADGTIKVRLTDASGVIQAQWDNILVIGPTGGGGGGGGATVDATAIFQTGDVIWLDQQGVRSGWVRDNGRTIGSSVSGATERANSDCQPVFEFCWNAYSDSICPVVGGRGASALADWSANKQLTLPDKRGYIPGGLDDMGGSAAGRFAGVPVVSGNATTPGSVLGETIHTLSTAEIPTHTHTASVTDPGHDHNMEEGGADVGSTVTVGKQGFGVSGGGGNGICLTTTIGVKPNTTGITVSNATTGGGGSHNNMQKTVLGTFFRKL